MSYFSHKVNLCSIKEKYNLNNKEKEKLKEPFNEYIKNNSFSE